MDKPERKEFNYKKNEFPLTVSGHLREQIKIEGYNQGRDAFETYHNSVVEDLEGEIQRWKLRSKGYEDELLVARDCYIADMKNVVAEKDKEIAKLSNSAQFRRVEMFQAELTRLKASRLTKVEVANAIPLNWRKMALEDVVAVIHKAQSEKK